MNKYIKTTKILKKPVVSTPLTQLLSAKDNKSARWEHKSCASKGRQDCLSLSSHRCDKTLP